MFKEIIVQRILDYIKEITDWKRNPSRHCKRKDHYSITREHDPIPKAGIFSTCFRSSHFMNSLLN
jgi:hypothetical protein